MDTEITPKTVAHSLDSPVTHTSVMEEFEDSDDEDETLISSSPEDLLIESNSGVQGYSLSLDEHTTIYSADSDNLSSAERNEAPETSVTSVDVPLSFQHAVSEVPISSSKTRIQVRDVAYTTYRAMLYYVSLQVYNCIRPTLI